MNIRTEKTPYELLREMVPEMIRVDNDIIQKVVLAMKEHRHQFATEAIKADRQRISQLCLNKATTHEGISFSCPFDVESIHSLPIQL